MRVLKPGGFYIISDTGVGPFKDFGVGQYLNVVFMRKLENAIEYAIPNAEILFDYLIRVEKVSKYIDYEEYLDSQYMDSLEVVYDIQSKVLKKRHSSNSIFIQRYQNIRYKGNEIFSFFYDIISLGGIL